MVGALALAIALVAGGAAWWWTRAAPSADAHIRNAWGPMLERGGNVTIAIGTPASLFVRDFRDAPEPVGDPPYRLSVPRDERFLEWYRHARGVALGKNAILHPHVHGPQWGDAAAAVAVSALLGAHGASVEVAPSARVHPVALRDKNAVIIGRQEYTDAVAGFTPENGLAIEYNAAERKMGVHNRKPQQGEPTWWFGTPRRNYGLITVLPSESSAHKRTILFCGINSDGAEAGARFFTSPAKLAELADQFARKGLKQWPAHYQVVVKTESLDTYALHANLEFLKVVR